MANGAVAEKEKPLFWTVRLTHPDHHDRIKFRSISERRARLWLVNHCPRGSEMHLISPDGDREHYEAERAGENGIDDELWKDFDPSEWVPASYGEPPGDSEWADREG